MGMILVADDFESEIALVKSCLAMLGVEDSEILVALDGAHALELIENHSGQISHVISDFNMPFYNGGQVLKLAYELGIRGLMLRSSHSVPTLEQKIAEYGLEGEQVELLCKREHDSSQLTYILRKFLQNSFKSGMLDSE
jgi:CheY-like chemotaxis protein